MAYAATSGKYANLLDQSESTSWQPRSTKSPSGKGQFQVVETIEDAIPPRGPTKPVFNAMQSSFLKVRPHHAASPLFASVFRESNVFALSSLIVLLAFIARAIGDEWRPQLLWISIILALVSVARQKMR